MVQCYVALLVQNYWMNYRWFCMLLIQKRNRRFTRILILPLLMKIEAFTVYMLGGENHAKQCYFFSSLEEKKAIIF